MAEYLDSTGLTYLCSKLDATYLKKANAVTVDTALSSSSTNPVQNKVINAALAGYLPFNNTYISDANSWLTNGYTKSSKFTTQNLPSVCTGADKWGVLFYISENATNGTGTQMFFPIDGPYKGRIFTRNILYKTPSDWVLIPLASDFATVATSGSYNDLSDTPTIPTVPTTVSSFTNDAGYLTEHQSLAGYAKTEDLATVATSGLYSDLSDTPTIPTVPTTVSSFTNDAGYLTEHQSLAAYAKTADLATVATSGSYNDLSDTPTIPDTSSFAQTSAENTWRSSQRFNERVIIGGLELYAAYLGSSTICMPSSQSFLYIPAKGNYTLDLSRIVSKISYGYSTVVTALITSTGDYTLTIEGLDVIRYIGSASDIAIKSTGTLLNILLCGVVIDNDLKVMGVIQATALNES